MKSNLYWVLLVLGFSMSTESWGTGGVIRDTEAQKITAPGGAKSVGRPTAESEELLTEIPSDIKDVESLKKYLKRFKQGKVIIKVGATWCGPCAQLHPEIEKLAESKKGEVKVLTLDVDNNPELANKLHPPTNPKYNQGTVPAIFEVEMGDTPKINSAKVGFFPTGTKSSQIGDWLQGQR